MPTGSWERTAAARLRSLARVVRSISHAAAGVENTFALYLTLLGRLSSDAAGDDAKRQRYLAVMDTQRLRLSGLYNAVFAFLPTGIDDTRIDVQQSFRHAAALAGTVGKDRGVELEIDDATNAPQPLRTPHECVRQALLEGLLTAVELAPDGTVKASLSRTASGVQLTVDGTAPPGNDGLPSQLADCQEELADIGGNVRWSPGEAIRIEIDLPCRPEELS